MAKYNPKDLKVKTNDELKEQIRLLRKEQFNLRFQVSKIGRAHVRTPVTA